MLVCLFWSVRLWIDWRGQRSMAKWRLFIFSVVGHCVLALDGSSPEDHLAFKEHSLRKHGLAGLGASDQDDIADVFC